MRKLALGLALALALPSSGVLALGLGEIDTQSALNQKLTAEIELLSVRPGELDGLVVGLADRRAFERAGIERPFYLTKLRFSVHEDPSGRAYIQISSLQPIREPFLDFLVEVNWANGRILREYTVLLDPPTMMAGREAQVQSPATKDLAAAPAVTTTAAPNTSSTASGSAVRPVATAPTSATSGGSSQDRYGPVRSGETLWNIAKRVRADNSVSVEQMMLALLRSNPDAFIGQNINRMRSGFVLRVPEQGEVLSVSAREALAEVRRQTALWRDYRNQLVANKPSLAASALQAADAKPAQPTSETADPQAAAQAASDAKLRLVAPAEQAGKQQGAQASADTSTVAKLRQELNLVSEAAEVQRKENVELRDRVAVLEDQINTMQRMLVTLQDQDLSALQQRLQAEQQAPKSDPALAATQSATSPTPELGADDDVISKLDNAIEMAQTGDLPDADEAEEQVVSETPAPAPVVAPTPTPQVEKPTRIPPVEQPSFFDRLLQDPMALLLGGGGVLVALLLFFVARRSRKKAEQAFPESILQEAQAGNEFEPSSEEITSPAEDTSFLDDLAVSDMSTMQTDLGEADPLAEADVFLAYGRYQQAEELIKDAIDMNPERNDLKLKLLEIYHAGHNVDAFQTQAEVLYAALGGQADPLWDRAVVLGRELCPDAPLFSGDLDAGTVDEMDAEPFPDPGLGVDSTVETRLDASIGAITEQDLDDLWHQTPDAKVAGDQTEQDATAELSTQAFRDAQPADDQVHVQPGESGADSGLDFDLNVDFKEEEPAPEPSLDLSGFDEAKAADNAQASVDDLNVDFDLGSNPLEEAVGDYADDEQDSQESDEVTTKLDLAKAYIEMGDAEGARSILDEVLEEGSETQKAQAHELLQQVE